MESYRGRQSRESSETSELTRNESNEVAEEEDVTSGMDYPGKGYRSTEWTNEKHSLYLRSMEDSFVDQLHNSLGFLGSNVNMSNAKPAGKTYLGTGTPSGQFKVLRRGSWQRVNFKRPEYNKDGSSEFLASPWFKHFRPVSKSHGLAPPSLGGGFAPGNPETGSRDPELCSPGSITSSEQIHIGRFHSREQDFIGCGEEVSDQNFVDEEIKEEIASSAKSSKKMKMVINRSNTNQHL